MIPGKVKVVVSIYEDEQCNYCVDDEIELEAWADLVEDDGSVSKAMSYYENIEIEEADVAEYVEDKYKNVKFDYYIKEDSFKEEKDL